MASVEGADAYIVCAIGAIRAAGESVRFVEEHEDGWYGAPGGSAGTM